MNQKNSESEEKKQNTLSLWQGAMLVAGTCIGGGMLALPIQTTKAGFIPSLSAFFLTLLIMMITGCYIGELCIQKGKNSNIITLAKEHFGKGGACITSFIYLFLFYTFTVAYLTAIEGIISTLLPSVPYPSFWASCLIIFLLHKGAKRLGVVNQWLMYGAVITYLLMIHNIFKITPSLIVQQNWLFLSMVFPVTLNAFNFHLIVPSLISGLNYERKKLRKVILLGMSITFFTYLLWIFLVLGNVPAEILEQNPMNAMIPLMQVTNKPFLMHVSFYFSFFAIMTSFIGVSLAFFDMITDTVQMHAESRVKRLSIFSFLLLTSLAIASNYPMLFRQIVTQWAGLGISFVSGILPIAMIMRNRELQKKFSYSFLWKKSFLIILLLFFFYVMIISLTPN